MNIEMLLVSINEFDSLIFESEAILKERSQRNYQPKQRFPPTKLN